MSKICKQILNEVVQIKFWFYVSWMNSLCHAYLVWIEPICYITNSVNQDHQVSGSRSDSASFSGLTSVFIHAPPGLSKLLPWVHSVAVCACPELHLCYLSAHPPANTLQTYPLYTHLLYRLMDKQLCWKFDSHWRCGSKQNKSCFALATLGYHSCRHCGVIRIYLDGC